MLKVRAVGRRSMRPHSVHWRCFCVAAEMLAIVLRAPRSSAFYWTPCNRRENVALVWQGFNMDENMTFVIGTLNFVSRLDSRSPFDYKMSLHTWYTAYVEGFSGLGVGEDRVVKAKDWPTPDGWSRAFSQGRMRGSNLQNHRVDSESWGCRFEPHRRHCVVSLSETLYHKNVNKWIKPLLRKGSFLWILLSFLKVKVQNGGTFGVC